MLAIWAGPRHVDTSRWIILQFISKDHVDLNLFQGEPDSVFTNLIFPSLQCETDVNWTRTHTFTSRFQFNCKKPNAILSTLILVRLWGEGCVVVRLSLCGFFLFFLKLSGNNKTSFVQSWSQVGLTALLRTRKKWNDKLLIELGSLFTDFFYSFPGWWNLQSVTNVMDLTWRGTCGQRALSLTHMDDIRLCYTTM